MSSPDAQCSPPASRTAPGSPWRPHRRLPALLALIAAMVPWQTALAYGNFVHGLLPREILTSSRMLTVLPAVTPTDFRDFRRHFYQTAAQLPDLALRQRFLARYPSEAAFDAPAFKYLLALDPKATIFGFDTGPDGPQSVIDVLSRAATAPDLDHRDRNRLFRAPSGEPYGLADGAMIPEDPMILRMGLATGPSSQGVSHFGLAKGPLSSDFAVLLSDPRHFAIPADLETRVSALAQMYTDLAIAAGVWQQPCLAVMFEGGFEHYAGDVGNQIHTVQLGPAAFFLDAQRETAIDGAFSLWGLVRPPLDLIIVGVSIIGHHHWLSEEYTAKRLHEVSEGKPQAEAGAVQAFAALHQGSPAFRELLQPALVQPAWAQAMTETLIETSSTEGAALYEAVRTFAHPRLGQPRTVIEPDEDDPDVYMRPAGDPQRAQGLAVHYPLVAKAFGRVHEMFHAWETRYARAIAEPGADQTAIARIVQQQLDYRDLADMRLRAYLADKGVFLAGKPVTLPTIGLLPAGTAGNPLKR